MKYKVGDKTLSGEIEKVSEGMSVPYMVKTNDCHWFTESEIDAIICKPKRNIDHLIELWDEGKADKACRFMYDNIEWNKRTLYNVMFELFKPYIEPRKYPVLTSEELKAVKWLVEGGYHSVFRYQGSAFAAYGGCGDCDLNYTPVAQCLYSSAWINKTPIDLKELLEAQEGV